MKLGLVTYNLGRNWDIPTLIEHCVAAGFDGVELRSTHAHKVEASLTSDQRADVRRRFADSPVDLYGLGTAFEYHSADRAELQRNLEGTRQYVRLAQDVGAMGIKVRPNGLPAGVPEERTLEQIGGAFREVARFGAEHGVQIWMEVHGRGTAHPARMKRIIDVADHPNAMVCWNCNRTDLDENGGIAWGLEPLIDKLGEVHIHDLYEDYPYGDLFRRLLGVGFRQYTGVEAPASPDAPRLMKFYRALWNKMVLTA